MKTKSLFLAVLGCMFMFVCSNEKDTPANTRLDGVEEIKPAEDAGICFSCTNIEAESDGDFLVTPSYFEGGYVKCRDFITSCAKDFVNKNK